MDDPNNRLLAAAQDGDWEAFQAAKTAGANVQEYGPRAVETAIEHRKWEFTNKIIQEYNLDFRNNARLRKLLVPLLCCNVRYSRDASAYFLLRLLISHGAHPSGSYRTSSGEVFDVLQLSAMALRPDFVDYFITNEQMDPNDAPPNKIPFLLACAAHDLFLTKYQVLIDLLDSETNVRATDVRATDADGNTALHVLVRCVNDLQQGLCIHLLLESGAVAADQNNAGLTAYDVARQIGANAAAIEIADKMLLPSDSVGTLPEPMGSIQRSYVATRALGTSHVADADAGTLGVADRAFQQMQQAPAAPQAPAPPA